eukprot:g1466.t1 g1466   contig10:2151086-2151859(-)
MPSKRIPFLSLCLLASSVYSFSTPSVCRSNKVLLLSSPTSLHNNKWDSLIDDDDDEEGLQFAQLKDVPRDMKYNLFNLKRQRDAFDAIRSVAGKELTNDVYARDPTDDTRTFFFVGKLARVSDVSLEKAIARQWPMIEEHSARLRPLELYPKWGQLELWVAPGDSELDVAYCRPDIPFTKQTRDVEGASNVRNIECGFQGEVYENDEEGFRTVRDEDGKPVRSEIADSSESKRQPTDAEMDDLMEMLNSQVAAADSD